MGSKRWMLGNGLGDLIAREVKGSTRFIDLFAGSAAVSHHVATKYPINVHAYDLQDFSKVLAGAILGRSAALDDRRLWVEWYSRARALRALQRPPSARHITREIVNEHRAWCGSHKWTITNAYGGYYFSALQSIWLDSLRQALPQQEPQRTVALAALLHTASKCAAAPGHTAQPFNATRTAKPFLVESWQKDILFHCRKNLRLISGQHARTPGQAEVADANKAADLINEGDLVFVDPPYSGVHYSRFYHVLETLARGTCGGVFGAGRYPPVDERPRSRYSVPSEAADALRELFTTISTKGARVIVTFPQRRCSNAISGQVVTDLANRYFKIERSWVASQLSTLGGNNEHRFARQSTRELILLLRPK